MNENKIKDIFKKLDIRVNGINKASNSFNSNVYIITTDCGKYVLKISNSEKKMIVESKYMRYLSTYLSTPKVIDTGVIDEKNYIVMTFVEGDNKLDEEGNTLSDNQIKNVGILLGKLHKAPLIDEDNNSWIKYLNDTLEKTQEILKQVFGKDNAIIYNYLKKFIINELDNNYKNVILHMDYRIGNLIFNDDDVTLIDMESMKNGDYVFDFVKTNRVLTKCKFKLLLDGYKLVSDIGDNFVNRLNFYSLFDSYTSLWWSASRGRTDSDFYKLNYKIVMEYLDILNEKGYI